MTPLQQAAVVVAATLFIIGLVVLLIIFIRMSQRLTAENASDTQEFKELLAAANAQADLFKNEATKFAAEVAGTIVRLEAVQKNRETDTLTFGRELRAAQDERDHIKNERDSKSRECETLKQEQEIYRQTIREREAVIDKANALIKQMIEKVRNLTAKLAETNAALLESEQALIAHADGRLFNGSEQPRVGGKFAKAVDTSEIFNPIRSVTSLTDKECIEVKNDEERDEILRLFEEAGVMWKSGIKATDTRGVESHCCLDTEDGYLTTDPLYEYVKLGFTILPASDFIDTPAPTPVKQLSEVNAELKEKPLDAGYYVEGSGRVTGTIYQADRPDDSHAGEQIAPAVPEPFDPTKYKAFPDGYELKYGEEIEAVILARNIHIELGTKGKLIGDGSNCPRFVADNKKRQQYVYTHWVAPLDPRQHPEHPEFKPAAV